MIPKSVCKKHRFWTSFARNRKWQTSIPIEPARSELISEGVGPSPTTTEFPSEIGTNIDQKSTTKIQQKLQRNSPRKCQENNTEKHQKNHRKNNKKSPKKHEKTLSKKRNPKKLVFAIRPPPAKQNCAPTLLLDLLPI